MAGRKHYVLKEDMAPYLHPLKPWNQQQELPNLEEITDPLEIVRWVALRLKPNTDYYNAGVKLPGRQYSTYCTLFLDSQPGGGGWGGGGMVLTHDYPTPKAFRFALCKHEKTEEGHNPNHGRGWHPGHCVKCNMDMTVDSGD